METNLHLQPANDNDQVDTSFDYRGAVGMLLYSATCTRPILAYVVGQLSRFVAAPTKQHVGCIKRVLRYLDGNTNQGIHYKRQTHDRDRREVEIMLNGYCDSAWASDVGSRKSTGGFVFELSGGAVAWASKRQQITAVSTAEAEYVAACEAMMEAIVRKDGREV